MSNNTVKKDCPFYNDTKNCKKIQSDRNCYQCKLCNFDILMNDTQRLRQQNLELTAENNKLKILIGKNVYEENTNNQPMTNQE